jgi:hypothetical protein
VTFALGSGYLVGGGEVLGVAIQELLAAERVWCLDYTAASLA